LPLAIIEAAVLTAAANSGTLQFFMVYYMNRLDKELHERKLVKSRSAAAELIAKGKVIVNGEVCDKPAQKIGYDDLIEVSEQLRYVSRGGLKLEHVMFRVRDSEITGQVCLDVGASTGGFTDCLLQHGARRVYAVDVGTYQLDERLRKDKRVISMENCDLRTLDKLPELVDIAVVDVSFISLKLILPELKRFLKPLGGAWLLIKPQFELGKKHKGVITDRKVQDRIVTEIRAFAESIGYRYTTVEESPILGKEGNREFFMWVAV
jgi:23S rRNA (cytidine1920-2'-O)/16S rRNA (cytidine1409-2'-O)-methyltransferase